MARHNVDISVEVRHSANFASSSWRYLIHLLSSSFNIHVGLLLHRGCFTPALSAQAYVHDPKMHPGNSFGFLTQVTQPRNACKTDAGALSLVSSAESGATIAPG